MNAEVHTQQQLSPRLQPAAMKELKPARTPAPQSSASVRETVVSPRVWLVLAEKQGDNRQLDFIEQALPWCCERKNIQMLPAYVLGKPRVAATLEHIDQDNSDPLESPWPDLILTTGRRPTNVALWIQAQSAGHTRIVLVGKPSGTMEHFDLVIHSAEAQLPPLPNVLPIILPLTQVNQAAVDAEADIWRPRFADLPQPLVAILVGGPAGPFVYDDSVASRLIELAADIIENDGGTAYIVTSRRTPPKTVAALQAGLPKGVRMFVWTADAEQNPYCGLLGLADGFIVTGDSISMMIEVIRLDKPLAILGLPRNLLGGVDQARRSLATWLFNPARATRRDRIRQRLAVALYRSGLLTHTRDFLAFHRMLMDRGLAVRAGEQFRSSQPGLPDELPRVVTRIKALMD